MLQPLHSSIDGVVSARSANRLRAFRREIENAFPGELEDVLLFGSRARVEAKRGSDFDVAVIFRNDRNGSEVRERLSDIAYQFVRVGTPIRPLLIFLREFQAKESLPIFNNVARDGISIS